MANSLDGYANQDPMRTTELLESIAAYVSLLRHHIHTEDHVFYPLARNTLNGDEFKELQRLFDMERKKHNEDTFELSHKAVTDMGSILIHLRQSAEAGA